jgi:methylenetetrahydrofolate dehydrogenase (NADP+)/methenyltetrahydrofolate cyclohydrolase
MSILDGKFVSGEIQKTLKEKVEKYVETKQRPPGLCIISVGYDPSSKVYIRQKKKMCKSLGYYFYPITFTKFVAEEIVILRIRDINSNSKIDGILVQLPLPSNLNANKILSEISPAKDVDGLGPYHIGNLVLRTPTIHPCTPYGIITLLEYYHIPIKGKHAVIVGASNIVGRPMMLELLLAGVTCTICHSMTIDLDQYVRMADVLIVALGKRDVVKSEWIKQGAIVIDVGINRLENGMLCGDVDFETAKERVSHITPVPGGVGPMTVISLMKNVMQVYEQS